MMVPVMPPVVLVCLVSAVEGLCWMMLFVNLLDATAVNPNKAVKENKATLVKVFILLERRVVGSSPCSF